MVLAMVTVVGDRGPGIGNDYWQLAPAVSMIMIMIGDDDGDCDSDSYNTSENVRL